MIKLDAKAFARDAAARMCGFETYRFIMDRFEVADVSKDDEFQRKFTFFYRVRRARGWLDSFYAVFQSLRNVPGLRFEKVLEELSAISDGRLEISFASKLLATIRPEMPIWDKFVRINLGLPELPDKGGAEDRFDAAVSLYGKLVEETEGLLRREDVRREISEFDKIFPAYACFTSMKKLDFLLWGANRIEP